MSDANVVVKELEKSVNRFSQTAKFKINEANLELLCCQLITETEPESFSVWNLIPPILIFAFILYLVRPRRK
jgi:hypothetical protein